MVGILHRVGVRTPTPDKVYDAPTTFEGLAGWWTEGAQARWTCRSATGTEPREQQRE